MSVIVAIKHNGVVYMGADSQVTKGGSRTTLRNPNNYKIWKIEGSEHGLMGSVGNLRDACVMRLSRSFIDDYDEYLNRVDYRYVVTYVVPEIIKTLKKANFIKSKDDYIDFLDSSYLFAHQDKLYNISNDCSVVEVDDFVAIGSGAPEAIGSLLSTEGEDPRTRIIKAIKASAATDIYVDYPIILSDTNKCEFLVITEDSDINFQDDYLEDDQLEESEEEEDNK